MIAAGGDGTIASIAARRGAARLGGTDNVLAVLPFGTGNDFARSLRIRSTVASVPSGLVA